MGCMLDSFSHTHEPQLKNTNFPICNNIRFVDCTSISEPPIPPHPIGLKSGGHLCTVNSMSHSGNQFEMIWDGKLTCWKQPSDDGYAVHKGMEMVSRNTRVTLWHLTMFSAEDVPRLSRRKHFAIWMYSSFHFKATLMNGKERKERWMQWTRGAFFHLYLFSFISVLLLRTKW